MSKIGSEIASYAKEHLTELKKEEEKSGRKLTQYDIANIMLSKGVLKKSEFNSWMNTKEGFNASVQTKQEKQALRQGNIWSISGYGGSGESYLESLVSFANKSSVEKAQAIYAPKVRLGETPAQKKKREAEITEYTQNQRNLHPEKALQNQKFIEHLNSLPDVSASYTELMDNINFKNMSKEEKVSFLLKKTGEKFYEAKEKGDKATMKATLLQGIGLVFQEMDNKSGITKFKDWAKQRSGLNALVATVDKLVDDGNDKNLSFLEKGWSNVKGVGDAADSFVGTQGIAMAGAFMAMGEAVSASATATLSAKAAQYVMTAFQGTVSGVFGVQGGKLVYDGAKESWNATTKEQAQEGGQKIGTGLIMTYGAVKGGIQTMENIKGLYQAHQVEVANEKAIQDARATLGIEDGAELTESNLKVAKKAMALKVHPDKGGSEEAMQNVNSAYDLLMKSIQPKTSPIAESSVAQQTQTDNVPVKMTKAQEMKATKTSYTLMNTVANKGAIRTSSGELVEFYNVPKGTAVSTPTGYKTVGEGDVVIKRNGALTVADEQTAKTVRSERALNKENLNRAGFTDEVIADLKKQSDFYGPGLIDETVEMINSLEYDVAAGKPITKQLIENTIDRFSPGASGGSFAAQRQIIANYWTKGDQVYKAYGQTRSTLNGIKTPSQPTSVPVASEPSSYPVTRANGKTVDVLANIPQETLTSKTSEHLKLPQATTVADKFGVTITQGNASPVEAKRIIFANTVEETLRVNNEHGIPLKYEANPKTGEAPYFYKDAPYGGRQKVNTQSVEVTYSHEATADWGLTPEYVSEYADANGMCPDRAVVAAGNDPVTGLKGNIAEKQYEVVDVDEKGNVKPGSNRPLVVSDLNPGQQVHIIKKQGVELKMAVFDEPTVSLEGETLPAGKLMMIDSEGHPYNGNPVKRLRSGEVDMPFDTSEPTQANLKKTLDTIKDLDTKTKAAKNQSKAYKTDNPEQAAIYDTQSKEYKAQADALAKQLDTDLTTFVKSNQNPSNIAPQAPTAKDYMLIGKQLQKARIDKMKPEDIVRINKVMNEHPNIVQVLMDLKDNQGNPRLDETDINMLLLNIITKDLQDTPKIIKALDYTEKIGMKDKAFGVWKSLYD